MNGTAPGPPRAITNAPTSTQITAKGGKARPVPIEEPVLECTERRSAVIDAFTALASAVIIIRRLSRSAWSTHGWETRPDRRP